MKVRLSLINSVYFNVMTELARGKGPGCWNDIVTNDV
jgi:hypothetical protein